VAVGSGCFAGEGVAVSAGPVGVAGAGSAVGVEPGTEDVGVAPAQPVRVRLKDNIKYSANHAFLRMIASTLFIINPN